MEVEECIVNYYKEKNDMSVFFQLGTFKREGFYSLERLIDRVEYCANRINDYIRMQDFEVASDYSGLLPERVYSFSLDVFRDIGGNLYQTRFCDISINDLPQADCLEVSAEYNFKVYCEDDVKQMIKTLEWYNDFCFGINIIKDSCFLANLEEERKKNGGSFVIVENELETLLLSLIARNG